MSTSQLNQIIAVEKSAREQYNTAIQSVADRINQEKFFNGLVRTYAPIDDNGESLPDEFQPVALRVSSDILPILYAGVTRLFDIVATKDFGNTTARADVVVGEKVILQDVPVPFLLFLDKELERIDGIVRGLPTLPINDNWQWSEEHNAYQSSTRQTTRTTKAMRNHVKAEATPQHPAQVEVYTEDIVTGYWSTTRLNSAISLQNRNKWRNNIATLLRAVRFARELANTEEIDNRQVGETILDYVFN